MQKKTDLIDTLKKLKAITPDATYAQRSRDFILNNGPRARVTVWQLLSQGVQSGSAVALVGIFMLLFVGAFSTWQFLSPFRISSLDPAGLRAEAQALDIQIQLTDVDYAEPQAETTPAIIQEERHTTVAKKLAKELGVPLGATATSSTSTDSVSIDEALDLLAE